MTGTDGHITPSLTGVLLAPSVTAPARALNTPFTPHPTRPVLGFYSVTIGGVTSLLSGDAGRIELRSDPGAPVTVRTRHRVHVTQGIGVTIGTTVIAGAVLSFLIPAGWQVTLATVTEIAAPSYALTTVCEVIL